MIKYALYDKKGVFQPKTSYKKHYMIRKGGIKTWDF